VELIPGAASAIYGLNAISGIANLKTKNPFKYPGLSIYQKTGVNHVDGKDHDPALYSETAIRYAKVIREKFAFKINAAYSRGYDWVANNLRDLNPNANISVGLSGEDNPARDPINSYGNEGSNRRTVTLNGKNYIIARTGYLEKEITDYSLKNFKIDASLHYKIGKTKELSYTYRFGEVSNQYQRGNRIRLDGLQIQQHTLDFKGQQFFVRAYYTKENTGNSYNLRPTGENMDRAFKSDAVWLNDYRSAYQTAINAGNNDAAAHAAARAAADNGRFQPGTAAFNSKLQELIHINNWDTGSALIMNTGFIHAEGQYDWSAFIKGIQVLTGFNYRDFIIHPDGNSYVNPVSYTDPKRKDEVLGYYSYGAFVQATKKLLNEKLKVVGSLRIDKTEYFSPKLNPRLAVVYTLAEKHNFRVSYQNGYRFPTLFEGFSFVDNGGIKRLGGLKIMSEYFNVFENSYIRASQDAFIAAVNRDVNTNGMNQNDAIVKNKNLLVINQYTYLRPEHINSFEVGYKTSLLNNKLFIDADFYFNRYKDFIGQVELTRPNRGQVGVDDSTVFHAFNSSQNKRYRMWTNSTSEVSNQGASLGVTWNFYKQFQVSGNVSYAALVTVSNSDALIPAFNTPKWISNISIGNRELTKNTGFNVTWRWQDAFFWQSPLADGNIGAYSVVDAQFTRHIPKAMTSVKLGASNLFNKRYYQYEGGPVIGGFYYLILVFDTNRK
ncbi:MAG TPA: TonB-dependent receptor, partial [Chitinophagaceae bacterium]|nr:TonB-dependent receptor [Chitinophagaceae bacterium]